MATDWQSIQSRTIDWLRFPMAVAVVILHHGTTLIQDATGPLRVLCILFQEGICRLAVPCFFFISGYLFFHQLQIWDWDIWKHKISRRAKTLLLPYILWNIIAFLAFWGYAKLQGNGTTLMQAFLNYGGIKIFWGVDGGLPLGVRSAPIDGPLWFIRDLMIFTILTPLLFQFIRKTRFYGVCALIVFFLFVPGIIPEGFIFFLTGAAVQLSGKNVVQSLWSKKVFLYVASGILLIAMLVLFDYEYWHRLVKNMFLFCGIGAAFCGAAQLLDSHKVSVSPFLAQSSFFIFATHEILILPQIAQPLIGSILPSGGSFWPCLEFFLTPALAVAICLGLFFILDKLLPRTTSLLTGNRKVQPARQT